MTLLQRYIETWDWLRTGKYITAIAQVPATWAVFTAAFIEAGRPSWLVYFNTVCAILLMDVMLLHFLSVLERANISSIKKIPYVIATLALTIANLAIGIYDEGWLALAPRIGLVALVSIDIFVWASDFSAHYFSREQVEQRIRNRQVVARRKLKARMNMFARWRLLFEFYRQQLESERRMLVGKTETPKRRIEVPAATVHAIDSPLPEGVIELHKGAYGWTDLHGNTVCETAAGNPYTLRGAQIARTRHMNQENGYGHQSI